MVREGDGKGGKEMEEDGRRRGVRGGEREEGEMWKR